MRVQPSATQGFLSLLLLQAARIHDTVKLHHEPKETTMNPDDLNSFMEIGRVVQVHADGSVTDANLTAPDLYWAGDTHELVGDGWALLNGYSGQFKYAGPIMHASEYIGGHMATDILAEPGLYVALVCEDYDDMDNPAGWAVATMDTPA